MKKNIDKNKINNLIKSLKLSKYLNKSSINRVAEKGDNLSGGQKQSGNARSLHNNPKILIFDEPTSALDKDTAKEIIRKFIHINEKNNHNYFT